MRHCRNFRFIWCLFCCVCFLAPSRGQSLAGRWLILGGKLDNGEQEKKILVLQQSGTELSGTLLRMGFTETMNGSASSVHFVLFSEWDAKTPYYVGDLVNGKLHMVNAGGHHVVARRATQADEFPIDEYIEPPPLRRLPPNGLALTPPMGWNSWNLFGTAIDDPTVRAIADAMVTSGMRDAGYTYVNIDDTWEGLRDSNGVLHSNHKFPDMKALADYVHSKGLKLGIYSSPGSRTCGGYPGSYGHEEQDARLFASWGIDYLKYDWCNASRIYKDEQMRAVYQKMGQAIQATGSPIVYSLCQYGLDRVETWGSEAGGNLWRTTYDISDSWQSMISNVEGQVHAASSAGPGHWNDPDMLEIGNGHMSSDEYRTHMSLWALSAAPLLAGNDIRHMSAETKSILMNREVIAIDQDPLGNQAVPVRQGNLETWVKPLADGTIAVGVVNLDSVKIEATVNIKDLPLGGTLKTARDLWLHQDVQFKDGVYAATIPPHGILLLKIRGH